MARKWLDQYLTEDWVFILKNAAFIVGSGIVGFIVGIIVGIPLSVVFPALMTVPLLSWVAGIFMLVAFLKVILNIISYTRLDRPPLDNER
ncbi:MAG: hypothetical protein ACFFE8_03210 [Candidatus Heimdallarchaeota archaeon]